MAEFKASEAEGRLNVILSEHGLALRNAIGARCRSNPALNPDELLQDARLRLWNALRRKGDIHSLSSYFNRVAAAVAIDAVRRAKVRREAQFPCAQPAEAEAEAASEQAQLPDLRPSPEAVAGSTELLSLARVAFLQLPCNRRRAVGLYLEGFSSREIAARLGWREAKARNLVYRGLDQLRAACQALQASPVRLPRVTTKPAQALHYLPAHFRPARRGTSDRAEPATWKKPDQ